MKIIYFVITTVFLLTGCVKNNINQLQRSKILSVYLTWDKSDTNSHMIVNYVTTSIPKITKLYWDTESHHSIIEQYPNVVTGKISGNPKLKFYVTKFALRNLNEKDIYHFVIGDQAHGFSREYKFRTLPSKYPFEFIQGGDMKFGSEVVKLTKLALTNQTRVIMMGGDLAYANGKKSNYSNWDSWLRNLNQMTISPNGFLIPIIVGIGNHETKLLAFKKRTKAPYYYLFFEQNGDYTFFDRNFGEDGVLLTLDSGHVFSHGGKQKQWLKEKFSQYKDKKFKFTMYHVPLYPSARDYTYGLSVDGRNNWLKIFDENNLTLSFENHDHMMKRTKLLFNNKISQGTKGTIYIGDGCWGMSPRKRNNEWYLEKSAPELHVWKGMISKSQVTLEAINIDGKTIDHFSINK